MGPMVPSGTPPTRSTSPTTRRVNAMSSQPVTETSGTESTATSELDPAVTARSETLVDGLEELSETAGPPPPPPSKAGRRFVLIVTGTVPGEDLTAERDLVLK